MYEVLEVSVLGEPDKRVGYIVRKEGTLKIDGSWIYEDRIEVMNHVNQLNEAAELRNFMPSAGDPEVQALVNSPDWDPVEYEEVEVPDLDNSKVVYMTFPAINANELEVAFELGKCDSHGRTLGPDGRPVINWQASDIRYKKELQPKRTQSRGRIDSAMTQVARARREAAVAHS